MRRTLALPSESRLLSLGADLLLFCVIGFDENIESQGELILQESFQVWDPKTLIRKGRERHLFLFEMSLVFSKEVKDSSGRSKYLYKSKLFVSIGIQHPSLPAMWLRPSCGERDFLFAAVCYLPNYSKIGNLDCEVFIFFSYVLCNPHPLEAMLVLCGLRGSIPEAHNF